MDMSMSNEEIKEYLSQPIIGRIATSRKNNKPLVHPIWFIYEKDRLIISTGRDSVKANNIRGNSNVSITIDTTQGGLRSKGVLFQGKAKLSTENTLETTKKIYSKYMENLDNPMVKQLLNIPRVIITIKPEKQYSWDNTKVAG